MIRQDIKTGLTIGLLHIIPFAYLYIEQPYGIPPLIVFVCIGLAWIVYAFYLWVSEIFFPEQEDK